MDTEEYQYPVNKEIQVPVQVEYETTEPEAYDEVLTVHEPYTVETPIKVDEWITL